MQLSRTRLTLYAILDALEADGRGILRSIASNVQLESLLSDLRDNLLRKAAGDIGPDLQLLAAELVDYLEFPELPAMIRKALPGARRDDPRAVFCKALEGLASTRNRVMHGRPLRNTDYPLALQALAECVALSELPLARSVGVNEALMSNPDFVLQLKIPEQQPEKILHNLPMPDFDDTGLVGREADCNHLKALLVSSRPVVSLIGEGGVGKSAAAISVLYDLLDDLIESEKPRFEAIIWCSLKTKSLTASGVRAIATNIISTVSLFSDVNSALGFAATADIDQIIEFMDTFPMILVIDNLETVNAGSLRDLLIRIPERSKILITSRIGVGELEERYVLAPLSQGAGVDLMRRSASNTNVRQLADAPNVTLKGYVDALYRNPLAIKWFVGRSANGAPIRQVLASKSELLQFCFENIFETFGANEITLLEVISFIRRPATIAELDYYSATFKVDYLNGLNRLLSTSMVHFLIDHGTGQTMYELTEFAAEYIRRFHRPSAERYRGLLEQSNKLRALEQEALSVDDVPFDPKAIYPDANSRAQLIAAAYLRRALAASSRYDRDGALAFLERARLITPEYADVFKIGGFIFGVFDDLSVAEEQFEEALALAPNDVHMHVAYGSFLLYRLRARFDIALEHAERAVALSRVPDTLVMLGRAEMFLGLRNEALQHFDEVIGFPGIGRKHLLLALDQAADTCRRSAESLAEQGDHDAMEFARKGYEYVLKSFNLEVFDTRLAERALRLCRVVMRRVNNVFWNASLAPFVAYIAANSLPLEFADRRELAETMYFGSSLLRQSFSHESQLLDDLVLRICGQEDPASVKAVGVIETIPMSGQGRYGFVRLPDGEAAFLPTAECRGFLPKVGQAIRFELRSDPMGRSHRVAHSVELLTGLNDA